MVPALLLVVCWVAAEVYVAVKVAEGIGFLYMLLALIVSWPLGTWALRSRGRAAWWRLKEALASGAAPGRQVLDGALVLIGGALMVIPGFITDVLGVALLVPPTRALVRAAIVRHFRSALVLRAARVVQPSPHFDVDSTASDIEQPRLRR